MSYFQRTKLDNAAGTTINPATSDAQTSGAQKTQIVDGSGNVISSQGNHLNAAVKLIDPAGVAYGVKHVSNKPRVSATPYLYDIAEGNITDHAAFDKIGFTPALTTTESTVWSAGGAYTYPTAPMQMRVVSSSANDSATGTGARTVLIKYLDTDYNEQTTTVTLDGTTPVNTAPTNILRINGMRVASAGSLLRAAGNISLQNTAGTVTYAFITAGFTRARSSFYTVPAGKNVFVTSLKLGFGFSSNSTHYARMYLRATQADGVRLVDGIMLPYVECVVANTTINVAFEMPVKFVEKVDIQVSGIATIPGIGFSAMRGWLESA